MTLSPIELFTQAEKFLRENGFTEEIDWCDNRPSFNNVNEQRFLLEYAWVVFNSGMKNSVIEAKWKRIMQAFYYFHVEKILENQDNTLQNVLKVFGNYKKVYAVIEVARDYLQKGFLDFREKVKNDPLGTLDLLPFIGPVTKYHLARNLGFDYVKPDRHLVRLASKYDLQPDELCNMIHEKTGRRLGTIDVILWRFCEQKGQKKLAVEGGVNDR